MIPPETATSNRSQSTVRARPRHPTTHGSSSTLDSPGIYTDGSYAALYEAALDVARAAERVERVNARRSESRRRQLSRKNTDDEEVGDGMMDSFHSDMSRQTSSSTVDNFRRMALSTGDLLEGRGRSLKRLGTGTPGEMEDQATPLATAQTHHYAEEPPGSSRRAKSRSLSLARNSSGRGGRRVAGVAFMSIGLVLRGWYSTTPTSTGLSRGGQVLAPSYSTSTYRHPPIHPIFPTTIDYTYVTFEKSHPPIPDEPPSYDRIIGRMSAWCCTTLYLTSRLPQIWKNVRCAEETQTDGSLIESR